MTRLYVLREIKDATGVHQVKEIIGEYKTPKEGEKARREHLRRATVLRAWTRIVPSL